jgi:GT2 family glycosyltransferase
LKPKVTVCVPTYNRAHQLRETLLAIQRQTFEDWEAVVGDDASSDDTPTVVRELGDARIRYHRNERNLGLYGNWNRLISLSCGQYVCIYHDHDVYLPTILERSLAIMDRNPEVVFAHTAVVFIDEAGFPVAVDSRPFPEVLSGGALRRGLADDWHSSVMAATAMVRRDAYARVGRYDYERYGLGCDKAMWFRLAALGKIGYVSRPQALIRARVKGASTTTFQWRTVAGIIQMRQEQLEALAAPDSHSHRRFARQRAKMLLTLLARAIALEPSAVVAEGAELVTRHGGVAIRATAKTLVAMRPAAKLAGRLLLPLHYSLQRRRQSKERLHAEGFVRKDESLAQLILQPPRTPVP